MTQSTFTSIRAMKEFRKQVRAMPDGTILKWTKGYDGISLSHTIRAGSYTKIVRVANGVAPVDNTEASKVYKLILCSKTGKEYTKTFFWNVGSIAESIDKGNISVV